MTIPSSQESVETGLKETTIPEKESVETDIERHTLIIKKENIETDVKEKTTPKKEGLDSSIKKNYCR